MYLLTQKRNDESKFSTQTQNGFIKLEIEESPRLETHLTHFKNISRDGDCLFPGQPNSMLDNPVCGNLPPSSKSTLSPSLVLSVTLLKLHFIPSSR